MSFEETELRLGLPGREILITRKRGFHETAAAAETAIITMAALKLNLISSTKEEEASYHGLDPNPKPPLPKAEVVGWPPIRSNRKNRSVKVEKGKSRSSEELENAAAALITGGRFVKVSVDGAPYLRKVDLSIYNSYKQLSLALANLFAPFTIRNCGFQAAGMKDFMNESKQLIDLIDGSDNYVHTYQDKDGDWMLVGDVPWQMFVESCMRLRIMKGKEAIGLAPRTIEKCKNSKS